MAGKTTQVSSVGLYDNGKLVVQGTGMRPNIRRVFASKGGRWFWGEYRHKFDDEFAKVVDQIIES